MDRDEFIIKVYCLGREHYQLIKATYPLRRGGFLPALSDEEVITLEICGEYFKYGTDKDLYCSTIWSDEDNPCQAMIQMLRIQAMTLGVSNQPGLRERAELKQRMHVGFWRGSGEHCARKAWDLVY